MIENGADVNAVMTVNVTGCKIRSFTPLLRLLKNPYSPTHKLVELLLEHGADANAVSLDDRSPLLLAVDQELGNYIVEIRSTPKVTVEHTTRKLQKKSQRT